MRLPTWLWSAVALAVVFGAGWLLRPERVREVPKVSERIVERWRDLPVAQPGQPAPSFRIEYQVPGLGRSRVEVPGIVVRPAPDVVRVITETVKVPVEVVRERWPQVITIRIGSVLSTEGTWFTPKNRNLVIGMVTPGVYAAPEQEGWKTETVTTDTRVTPQRRWSLSPYAGVGMRSGLFVGIEYAYHVRVIGLPNEQLALQWERRKLFSDQQHDEVRILYRATF